jgi:hypothetical protein
MDLNQTTSDAEALRQIVVEAINRNESSFDDELHTLIASGHQLTRHNDIMWKLLEIEPACTHRPFSVRHNGNGNWELLGWSDEVDEHGVSPFVWASTPAQAEALCWQFEGCQSVR